VGGCFFFCGGFLGLLFLWVCFWGGLGFGFVCWGWGVVCGGGGGWFLGGGVGVGVSVLGLFVFCFGLLSFLCRRLGRFPPWPYNALRFFAPVPLPITLLSGPKRPLTRFLGDQPTPGLHRPFRQLAYFANALFSTHTANRFLSFWATSTAVPSIAIIDLLPLRQAVPPTLDFCKRRCMSVNTRILY